MSWRLSDLCWHKIESSEQLEVLEKQDHTGSDFASKLHELFHISGVLLTCTVSPSNSCLWSSG